MLSHEEILEQLDSLIASHKVPLRRLYCDLANTSALLAANLNDLNWLGFYLVENSNSLILGPFQGRVACTSIPFGKGVCGRAWQEKRTIVVPNVNAFKEHIVCDSASLSEVVVPIIVNAEVVALLDVDSPLEARFTAKEVKLLEEVASRLGAIFA